MKKIIVVIVLVVIGIASYFYVSKNHRNIAKEEATYQFTAEELASQFAINPDQSESKYLNQVIEVSGTISEANELELVLDHAVVCLFQNSPNLPSKNKILTLKGRFIGYDNLLEQLKLDQCIIIN
nr:hypothetical protein [Mangrovimonas sp. ST2L15]